MVIPDSVAVIPDSVAVIPDSVAVIPDLIRDPVPRRHWIAGQARNDKLSCHRSRCNGHPSRTIVIPDSPFVIPAPDQVRGFNIRDPVVRQYWIAGRGPQ